mgnify:CR=1 FL=1
MADFGANVLASSVALIILLAVMGLVYYFWSKANIKKKSKYFEQIHTELAPGQEVMFAGGIFGTVKSVNGDKVEIKVRCRRNPRRLSLCNSGDQQVRHLKG